MSKVIESLTPTILVMNDAYFLPYVLECLRGHFNRYVIYDAGSEDGTLDIIDWFTETEEAEFFVRKLPFCIPAVQGCYRNSMLVEAETEWTMMIDGDEIYHPDSLDQLGIVFANTLSLKGAWDYGIVRVKEEAWAHIRYGVVRRTEIAADLRHKYSEDKTHHRLYRRDAYFHGNHPGEAPVYKQREGNEFHIKDVMCWHLHNVLRSPLESSVPKRLDRKSQGTYHPGDLVPFNLLEELPILRKPIGDFKVSPDLEKLQNEAAKM